MLIQSDTEEETNFNSKNQIIVMKTLDLNTAADELNTGRMQNNECSANFNMEEYVICNQNDEPITTQLHNIIIANTVSIFL